MPTAKPPEGLAFDRIPTPAGEALVMWDAQGRLRVFDWDGYESRMKRLLERHYGAVTPKSDQAPAALRNSLTAYFSGDLTAIDAIECATGGTDISADSMDGAARHPAPAGPRATAPWRPGSASRRQCARWGWPMAPIRLVLSCPCHRVIEANGSLTGYGGGIERKRWLLQHEGAAFRLAAGNAVRRAEPRPLHQLDLACVRGWTRVCTHRSGLGPVLGVKRMTGAEPRLTFETPQLPRPDTRLSASCETPASPGKACVS